MNPTSAETILIVDDHEINRYVTSRILHEVGYQTIEASSGQEALTKSQSFPDLVLLDVNLPDIDGFEVCRLIRNDPATSQIPIVHTSATFVSDDDRVQGLDTGADGYLTRPIEPRVLIATIRSCLRARRAEEVLKERERELSSLTNNSPDLIARFDLDLRFLFVNRAMETALGRSASEVLGHELREFKSHEKIASQLDDALRRSIEDRESGAIDFWLDGETIRRFSSTITPEFASDGKVHSVLMVARDVTEQKKLEDELRQLAENLSDANRRMNEFLATLAHELRNPLAPIRTGLEVLRNSSNDPDSIPRTLSMMERQTHQVIRLIDDLLDLSRITQGKLNLKKAVIEISEVLASAVDAIQPFIAEAGHELHMSISEEPIFVDGDPNRLAQVFANILSNASKYTKERGKIWLSLHRDADQAVISIKDNGLGIPTAMQHRIFEMFAQIDRPIEAGYTGLGIGLTLVKRIVEMHQGSVTVQSEGANKGSEFLVRLPLVDVANVPSADTHKSMWKSHARHKILVVDDNRDAAELLGIVLRVFGNDIRIAHDGREAIKMAEDFGPDVVFMDLGMPTMNGYQAAEYIRSQQWGKQIVLVALTGWGQEDDRNRTQHAGFNHHFTKPAEPAALQQLLQSLKPLAV